MSNLKFESQNWKLHDDLFDLGFNYSNNVIGLLKYVNFLLDIVLFVGFYSKIV